MCEEIKYNFYPFNYTGKDFKPIVYKNRCILFPTNEAPSWRGFACGYVVLKKTDIPKDWWGDYDAPGLQRLMIHGGLTYCQQVEVPNQKEITEKFNEKIKKMNKEEQKEAQTDFKKALKRMNKKTKLLKELNKELSKSDEGYVVFGFDCGHYHDEENINLKDPNHIMMLTEQMEDQLMKFKEHYEEYRDVNEAVKDIVRNRIIADIRREAEIQCEMGFGEMLDILKNDD